jgi:hypothetical protein
VMMIDARSCECGRIRVQRTSGQQEQDVSGNSSRLIARTNHTRCTTSCGYQRVAIDDTHSPKTLRAASGNNCVIARVNMDKTHMKRVYKCARISSMYRENDSCSVQCQNAQSSDGIKSLSFSTQCCSTAWTQTEL